MPSFFASALIADGVMSDEPTMYSWERLLLTVCRPLMPIEMATTPNTMRTAAEMNPPISSALRMSRLLSNLVRFAGVSVVAARAPSGPVRNRSRGFPPLGCGKAAGDPTSGGGEGLARPQAGRDRAGDVQRRD